MTMTQFDRYEIIKRANAGLITVKEAAEATGLSTRQIKRLKKKVREEGAAAVIHKNTLRTPKHAIPPETKKKILETKKSDVYATSNFKHFRELIAEFQGIEISYSALYEILVSNGIKSPCTRRRFKPHRRRKRRAQAGLLVQIDATPYAWFKLTGDKSRYAMHGSIDDATSQVTGLYMTKHECLLGYYELTKLTIGNYGVPVSAYADRHTIFQSPNSGKAEIDANVKVNDTQFGRALKELGVQLIAARSPQAKGRVERLWSTLQGRLPVEFAARGITTMAEANEFLKSYIYAFNSEFAVEPADAGSMFRPVPKGMNIDYILCAKESRVIDDGGVISLHGQSFKAVETVSTGIIPKGARVNALTDPCFGVKIEYRGFVFDVLPFVPPKRKKAPPEKKPYVPRPVPDGHYHKYGQLFAPKLTYEDSDADITGMLEDIFLGKMAK